MTILGTIVRCRYLSFVVLGCFLFACENKGITNALNGQSVALHETSWVDSTQHSIFTRFEPPRGYVREPLVENTFAAYLRDFPLLAMDEKVHLYNGKLKSNQTVHASILDIDVGNRDLQQCADAVMRLRAEYLWKQKDYASIAFDFTNGWKFEYAKWRAGYKLMVAGNKTGWKSGSNPRESYQDFRKYLDQVFMYAGTLSLARELKPKSLADLEIGNVFIQGGSPGHAVLVVDLAIHPMSGDKAFLLAQSYMPAQQIHILKNPNNRNVSPWYLLSEIDEDLVTPEWKFSKKQLMEF